MIKQFIAIGGMALLVLAATFGILWIFIQIIFHF